MTIMNTDKYIFTEKFKNSSIKTHFNCNKVDITSLFVCIPLILISLLVLVGVLS